ncbi:hypothetical protein RHSIM_Rhsim12G0030700 [Rhododendron simsii]|uniref:Uncharacterized protein n=1 Tax=Rhododendron simsii TaxID=118357 RepID=A0A834GA30_RHOSS|nr:hypothetical protein RHSIM_Rhsim12G0030700 [Rhododendron simsii]
MSQSRLLCLAFSHAGLEAGTWGNWTAYGGFTNSGYWLLMVMTDSTKWKSLLRLWNKSSNEKENSEQESEHKGAANVKVEENDGIGLCGVISSTRSSPGVLLRYALSLPASKQANTYSHRSLPPHPQQPVLLYCGCMFMHLLVKRSEDNQGGFILFSIEEHSGA